MLSIRVNDQVLWWLLANLWCWDGDVKDLLCDFFTKGRNCTTSSIRSGKKTNLDNGRNSPCWTMGLKTREVVFHLFSVRNCIDKGGILFKLWINWDEGSTPHLQVYTSLASGSLPPRVPLVSDLKGSKPCLQIGAWTREFFCRTRDFSGTLSFFTILYHHAHFFWGFLAGKKTFHWSSFEMSTEKGSVIGEAKVQRMWKIAWQPVLWVSAGCTVLLFSMWGCRNQTGKTHDWYPKNGGK